MKLKTLPATVMLMIPHPSNRRGHTMSNEELVKLVFIMRNLMVNSEIKQRNIQTAIELADHILWRETMAYVDSTTGEVIDDTENGIDEHDIYDQGYEACQADKDMDANPWPMNTYAWQVWGDGWDDYDAN